ncbi:MAG: helix-turn-helix domain-containing protein [Syntrophomonadaceae bacterium]|jgi:putative transposase
MLDNEKREQIALKRFSLISPVLNGQVTNQKEYFIEVTGKAINMPHYGMRMYSPKTIAGWLNGYRRGGIDALKPGCRSDRGKSRKINDELVEIIREKRLQEPRINSSMLYDSLVKDGMILPQDISIATFYRFLAANPDLTAVKEPGEEKEMKRFAHQYINELWQSDALYGVYLKVGKSKKQTYLIAFIDDASRYITYSQWSFSQNFSALRAVFKEAILRKGIPSMVYKPILLYHEGKRMGEARQVNFHENAHAKRKGPGRPIKVKSADLIDAGNGVEKAPADSYNHISFFSISISNPPEV